MVASYPPPPPPSTGYYVGTEWAYHGSADVGVGSATMTPTMACDYNVILLGGPDGYTELTDPDNRLVITVCPAAGCPGCWDGSTGVDFPFSAPGCCPSGSIGNDVDAECAPCENGTYAPLDAAYCEPCPAGRSDHDFDPGTEVSPPCHSDRPACPSCSSACPSYPPAAPPIRPARLAAPPVLPAHPAAPSVRPVIPPQPLHPTAPSKHCPSLLHPITASPAPPKHCLSLLHPYTASPAPPKHCFPCSTQTLPFLLHPNTAFHCSISSSTSQCFFRTLKKH